jgi:probable F420-dependent oxidoreductase
LNGIQIGFMWGLSTAQIGELEASAVDSLWAGGHVASRNPGQEAMMALARLCSVTQRVRVGTSVLLLPLYPPAIIAKQVADLDRLTGGRITLGVGIGGEYPAEFEACQVPLGQRGARTNEAIDLMRKLWTGEEVNHDGPLFPMRGVRIHRAPVQAGGPPIVVGGRKEPAMRRAALRGDGWMPYLYSPRRYAKSVATIRQFAAEANRNLDRFEWFAFVFVNAHPDRDRARNEAAGFLGGNYAQNFDEMIGSVAAVGTSDEVRARLQQFVDAGARHLILVPATRDGAAAWDIIQSALNEVVPGVGLAG